MKKAHLIVITCILTQNFMLSFKEIEFLLQFLSNKVLFFHRSNCMTLAGNIKLYSKKIHLQNQKI